MLSIYSSAFHKAVAIVPPLVNLSFDLRENWSYSRRNKPLQIQQEVIVKKSNFDLEKLQSAERLKANENFTPCPINEGDELYPNGIFVFNITKMIEYLTKNSNEADLVDIDVADFPKCFSNIDESHVDSVDVSRPVIIIDVR